MRFQGHGFLERTEVEIRKIRHKLMFLRQLATVLISIFSLSLNNKNWPLPLQLLKSFQHRFGNVQGFFLYMLIAFVTSDLTGSNNSSHSSWSLESFSLSFSSAFYIMILRCSRHLYAMPSSLMRIFFWWHLWWHLVLVSTFSVRVLMSADISLKWFLFLQRKTFDFFVNLIIGFLSSSSWFCYFNFCLCSIFTRD